MGRGLGLDNKSTGTYFAFSAGTGILVFIDLVARIALGILNLIPEEQKIHKDFKLIMFTSYQNKADSIALELLEGLNKMCADAGNT